MNNQEITPQQESLATLLARPEYKNRFEDVLGARAGQFMSSVLSLHLHTMRDVDPKSILASAMTAASLDLPINPNLGFAYIVAYADKHRDGKKFAQFQMGAKGFIQLAIRTRQYRFLNACKVFESELQKYDKLTGELVIDEEKKKSEKVVGYASYLRLTNGFEHALYMTVEQVAAHGKQYSQSFKKGYGHWVDNFEAMALKTLIKLLLSKWGVLSVQMEKAIYEDQAVKYDINARPSYLDNLEPIPQAQIADRQTQPAAAGLTETKTGPSETKSAPTETEAPKKRGRPAKSKPSLSLVPDEKKDGPTGVHSPTSDAGPQGEAAQPGGPFAEKLIAALNEKGFLLTDFLMLAFHHKWVPTPENYSGDPGDIDVTTISIPEEKVNEFLETDNFEMIVELLAQQKKVE